MNILYRLLGAGVTLKALSLMISLPLLANRAKHIYPLEFYPALARNGLPLVIALCSLAVIAGVAAVVIPGKSEKIRAVSIVAVSLCLVADAVFLLIIGLYFGMAY